MDRGCHLVGPTAHPNVTPNALYQAHVSIRVQRGNVGRPYAVKRFAVRETNTIARASGAIAERRHANGSRLPLRLMPPPEGDDV